MQGQCGIDHDVRSMWWRENKKKKEKLERENKLIVEE